MQEVNVNTVAAGGYIALIGLIQPSRLFHGIPDLDEGFQDGIEVILATRFL